MVRTNANLVAEAEHFYDTVGVDEGDVILAVVAAVPCPRPRQRPARRGALRAPRSSPAASSATPRSPPSSASGSRSSPAFRSSSRRWPRRRRAAAPTSRSLRLCFSAGAPLDRETFDLFHDRFGIPVRQLYGCSEAGSVTINLDADPTATADLGRPADGGRRAHRDDDDGSPAAPASTARSRSAAGPLTAGYVGGTPTANAAFVDGWFRTGDVGHLDDSGNLYVTGRTTLYIATGGHKVDPFEVEAVLREQPGVADVVVVGVPG